MPLDGVGPLELFGMFVVILKNLLRPDLLEVGMNPAAEVFHHHKVAHPGAAEHVQRNALGLEHFAEFILGLDVGPLHPSTQHGLVELVVGFGREFSNLGFRDFVELGEGVLEDHLALDELIEALIPDLGAALRAFRFRQVAGVHQLLEGGGEDFLVEDGLVVDRGADASGWLSR